MPNSAAVHYLPERKPAAKGGDGGDTLDPMEARVERLEDDMKELKADIKALRVDVAHVRGRVDAMPTTVQLLMFVVAIFVAAGLTRFFTP